MAAMAAEARIWCSDVSGVPQTFSEPISSDWKDSNNPCLFGFHMQINAYFVQAAKYLVITIPRPPEDL
ncbi:hypothetical protein MGG_16691 [Pyricularia oryzae 70-15]|uniref:Uncharacterized protein n=1 Tax=Pyricularia oryzae (strain 70-15 / ATCC MYA-4617 / FGSC 8958) TaxID=242507 RepID=G4N3F4_PYRO7|nr:uncharacterized protein MGG_16691 [Pyricularia oryzae 70-15]EHA51832.1 hypothetical protein MGG_16691 [Pyricularia oryzae 70-15]KAI6436187.1 hypothetical protein MCOR21_001297 [Pyricularia oryzae]